MGKFEKTTLTERKKIWIGMKEMNDRKILIMGNDMLVTPKFKDFASAYKTVKINSLILTEIK